MKKILLLGYLLLMTNCCLCMNEVEPIICEIEKMGITIEDWLPYNDYSKQNLIRVATQLNINGLMELIKNGRSTKIKQILRDSRDKIRANFIRAQRFTARIVETLDLVMTSVRYGGANDVNEIPVSLDELIEIQRLISVALSSAKDKDPLIFLHELETNTSIKNLAIEKLECLVASINGIAESYHRGDAFPPEEIPCPVLRVKWETTSPVSRVDLATDAADSGRAEAFANRIMAILTRGFRFGGNLLEDETEIRVTRQQFAQIQENMDKIFQLREAQNALDFLNADTWDNFIGSLEQNQEAILQNTGLIRNVLRAYGGGEELPNDRYAVFRFVIGEGEKSSVGIQTAAEITTPKKPAGRKSPSSSPRAGSSKSSSAGRSEISNLSRTDQKNDKRIDHKLKPGNSSTLIDSPTSWEKRHYYAPDHQIGAFSPGPKPTSK